MNRTTLSQEKRKIAKEKIFNAAREIFAKKGFLKATISEIAEQAKVSKGLIHWYYKNKDELIKEVALSVIPHKEMMNVLQKDFRTVKDLFYEICNTYIDFYTEVKNRKLFLYVLTLKEKEPEIEQEHKILAESVMKAGAQKLISLNCNIDSKRAEVVFRTLYSSLFFYVQNKELMNIPENEYVDMLIEILLKGINCS
ncbi:MAG: TetR/AcrR family transcriptional regulator [Candidatus Asgardarchaeia archaeon]